MRNPSTVSTQRILILIAAAFGLGLAVGLALYPSVGSPSIVSGVLMFFSAMLILFSLRWEHRP